jgi:hypothetical protein
MPEPEKYATYGTVSIESRSDAELWVMQRMLGDHVVGQRSDGTWLLRVDNPEVRSTSTGELRDA